MGGPGSSWSADGTQAASDGDALRASDRVDVGDALGSGTSGFADAGDALRPPGPALTDARRADDDGTGGEAWSDDDGTGGEAWSDASALGGFVLPPMPALGGASEHADALNRWMDDDRARTEDAPPPVPGPCTSGSPRTTEPGQLGGGRSAPRRIGDPAPPRPGDEAEDDHLDPSLRTVREERDFERQFGAWREGGGRAPTTRPASKVPVLLLVILVVVIAWFALVGGMR